MEKRKNEKITSLIVTLAVVMISLLDCGPVGICSDSDIYGRMAYPFFHANIIHSSLNAWCLLSVVFMYDVSMWRLLLAYLSAVSIPEIILGEIPTVGMSGMIYFLFASITFEVGRKVYYQMWMVFYLAIGFLLPGTNALIHLYCYALGLMYAVLNKPIER